MKQCICIPVEQYELMLETYDKVVKELEDAKKPLKKRQLLQRQSNPNTYTIAGYVLIIRFIRQKIKEDLRKMHNETLASEMIAELQETADKKKQLIELINNVEKPELIEYLLGLLTGIIEKWG